MRQRCMKWLEGMPSVSTMVVMSWKWSVLLKSVGIAIVMAQIGWNVPAESFEFAPYKHLGCRAGHMDDVTRGHSTFTVEMTELKRIMAAASKNSFCMLDA